MPKKKGKDKGPPVPVGDMNIFGPLIVLKQVPFKKTTPAQLVFMRPNLTAVAKSSGTQRRNSERSGDRYSPCRSGARWTGLERVGKGWK